MKNRLSSHTQLVAIYIGASPCEMRVIEQGYSLLFTEKPSPAFFLQKKTVNQCVFKHQAFVSDEI